MNVLLSKYILSIILFLTFKIGYSQKVESIQVTKGAEREFIPKLKDTINHYYEGSKILKRRKYRDSTNLYIEWYSKEGIRDFMRIFPLNNLKNKTNIEYNRKGIVVFRAHYLSGIVHGRFEKFYDDGIPKVLGYYDKIAKDSIWKYYNKKGILTKEEVYKKGILLSKCEYFKQ